MSVSRRRFLQHGMTVVAAGVAVPPWLQSLARAEAPGGTSPASDRILVVLQLSGGNDGLNTVVPYASPGYREARPELGVPDAAVLHLDNEIGLHPHLVNLKKLFDSGRVAVVQGVGYPNPNRSHFRSMEIWHTAAPESVERYGWIGRCLDANPALSANPLAGINVGVEAPKAVAGARSSVLSVSDVEHFGLVAGFGYHSGAENPTELLREIERDAAADGSPAERLVRQTTLNALGSADRIRDGVKNYHSTVPYPPQNPVAHGFQQVARLLAANLGTRIYYVSTGGFDTHAREKDQHDLLMQRLDEGLSAFYTDLEAMGLADRVVVMAFSEFGRRVAQNAGGGTDHGTAGPMFVIGGALKGGVYGSHPDLNDLDQGDLKFSTDFRSVYATVLDQWLNADSSRVLGGDFGHLPLLKV